MLKNSIDKVKKINYVLEKTFICLQNKIVFARLSMLNSPLSLHFEVTDSCNNFCNHCYGSSWIQPSKQNLNKRVRPPLIEVARKIVNSDIFDVVITGGEPLLLGVDNLNKIFELFNNNNIQYSLNSNGRLLGQDTCKLLKLCGLRSVLISLHSWTDVLHDEIVNAPNASIETKAGIRNAIEQGLRVTVNQVINTRNIDSMYISARELEKMGVHQISFTRALSPLGVDYTLEMIDAVRFLDEFIRCKEILTIPVTSLLPIPFCTDPRVKDLDVKLNCSGGISTAVISSYGDVRFCPHDPHIWGNVFQEDLDSIWERIVKWRNDSTVPVECNDCSFAIDCRGGCRVASKLCYKDYAAKDPWARNAVTNYKRKVLFDEFDPECMYLLASYIRWRKENEAFLLYYNNGRLLVNSDGVEFVKCLPKQFVPSELINTISENSEIFFSFLKVLYHNGLIVKQGKTLHVDAV